MIEEIFALPMVRFLIVGGLVYVFGMALLVWLVEGWGMSKGQANLVVLATTLQLSFFANSYWSFGAAATTDLAQLTLRWIQYHVVRAIPVVLEQAAFVYLTQRLKLHYVLVSLLVVVCGFLVVYVFSAAFIFVKR